MSVEQPLALPGPTGLLNIFKFNKTSSHSPKLYNFVFRKPDSNITEAMAIKILKLGNHGDELKLNKFSEEEVSTAFQKQLQNKSK